MRIVAQQNRLVSHPALGRRYSTHILFDEGVLYPQQWIINIDPLIKACYDFIHVADDTFANNGFT